MAINKTWIYPLYSNVASLRIGDSITVTTEEISTTLANFDRLDVIVKNITITFGSRDVAAINTLGTTQVRDLKRSDISVVKFTVAMNTLLDTAITGSAYNHFMEYLHGSRDQVGTSDYYRIQGGWDTTSDERKLKCLLFHITGSQVQAGVRYNAIQDIVLNNALCTDTETTLDAEGHQETTFTFKALAADTYTEFKKPL